MNRRQFLCAAGASTTLALAGCSLLEGKEDAKRAARSYRFAYFNFQEARDEMMQARLAGQEGRSQSLQDGLNAAKEGFDTANGQFQTAAELSEGRQNQIANDGQLKSDHYKRACEARLEGNMQQAYQHEDEAHGLELSHPDWWRSMGPL